MDSGISYVTLGVTDLDRSVRFYEVGLGLSREAGPAGVAFFDMGGVRLALYPRQLLAEDAGVSPEGWGFAGFALAHNVASAEAADRLLRDAAEAGGRIVKPAQAAAWGGYAGYFADPDGFLWEVAWNPRRPPPNDPGRGVPQMPERT
jgi:catechol 2,3-dioxygenase-like lactoylglutathione lyase family enzyme